MTEEKPFEAAAEAAAQELVKQLWSDAKLWVPSIARSLKATYQRATRERFDSLPALTAAVRENKVQDGELVTVNCKPSPFGPYLRSHFLSPFIGPHTGLRLGPPLVHENPAMAIMAQTTSQLIPVGLYPPIASDINQVCLYPSETTVTGFVGLFPGVNELVPFMPALFASRLLPHYGKACHVTGVLRLVEPAYLSKYGVDPERYEAMRQQGAVWFFDATGEEAGCVPSGDGVVTELWGGLYASGHLDIRGGELEVDKVVEGFHQALAGNGIEATVHPNLAGRREIMIFAKGTRMCLDTQAPYYSLHMDVELAHEFERSRARFDNLCKSVLTNIQVVCNDANVVLSNPNDLDFSYTNSSASYTVMKSLAADKIRDPLAIAIRDWHKSRGS